MADASRRYTIARTLKEWGISTVPTPMTGGEDCLAPLPRICVQHPRIGFHHPAAKAEIARALRFFGETCFYGIRSIALVQGNGIARGEALRFGTLIVPGAILLYDQRPSPWVLPGMLPARERARLARAGAIIEPVGVRSQTIVSWPGATLRDFMLFDVLMHEIGHHLRQHEKGKRTARVFRTRDHEAFADHFARHCRLRYAEGGAET